MAAPFEQSAFALGEVAPNLWGRQDLARMHVAASTMRNMFVRYTGGASSRAGTKFVGFSKQTGRAYPPRMIPFQFSIEQGLALEFGNEYMRVIQNGAFVLESPMATTGISQADPAVVTVGAVTGGVSATPDNTSVTASYAPLERVTLAGGTFTTAAVLEVDTTKIKSVSINSPGEDYAAGDTIALTGGTQTTLAELTVVTTKVIEATISNAGAGGTPGPAVVTGTTGTGTAFQAIVTIDGTGVIISVDSISVAGSYTVNPGSPEPVTGGGLAGAELAIVLGIEAISVSNAGVFTANPSGLTFSQASTSGSGTGATFQFAIMSIDAVHFETAGAYTAFPANPVDQESTTGSGAGATFTVTSGSVSPYNTGDWITLADVVGMTQVSQQTYVITVLTPTTFSLADVYGNTIDSTAFTAYISGGTASRVYTLTTPYSEVDLRFLKYTQSADVMSLCLVNQENDEEYAPLDLVRNANDDWEFESVIASPTIEPPSTVSGVASAAGSVNYHYVITSVDPENGTESIASPIAAVDNAVNLAATAGSIRLTWSAVAGVNVYNIYKASPTFGTPVPVGALFGFAGQAYGTEFVDSNIIPDLAQVPPQHKDPFARGQIISGSVTAGGAGYTEVTLTINTSTGTGALLTGVIVGGALVAIIVDDNGRNYADTDTVSVTGDGAGATATLKVGAQTGTYPGVASYFQQRRTYGYTLNQPDTYFMSQPAAFKNFDRRIPTIDTDAITGNPWAVQVNGIQAFLQMPGGLVVFTGKEAWQLTGNGGSSLNPQPITPTSQDAQPQAFNGCHQHVVPQKIENEILYLQAKGSIIRDLSYNYFTNIYTGTDLTLNSSQLFNGFAIEDWAWCEEPYKVMWVVRNDGVLLSLTFVKPQEVAGWARHDTQGLYKAVCSVTEPPVDALYTAVQRTIGSNDAYTIERMDNRLWSTVEEAWTVDCALSLPQPTPDATLTADTATGLGAISGYTDLAEGSGYSAFTTAAVVDDNGQGPGTGAAVSVTVTSGRITALTIDSPGSGYTFPKLVFSDPAGTAGSGAQARLTLDNSATFIASVPTFASSDEGSVIRMGGGVATITSVLNSRRVIADITSPITVTIPNTDNVPQVAMSGDWSLTAPTSTVTGLQHLAGATITGLYDGAVLDPVVVPASGMIDLPTPATAVTLGLGFTAQLQSVYMDPQGATVQGSRKKIADVVVRVSESRDFTTGSNQPDGSIFSPLRVDVEWQNMTNAQKGAVNPSRRPYNSTVEPLWSGDTTYVPVHGGYGVPGQVAVEQRLPLPLNVLALISQVLPGDLPQLEAPKRRNGANQQVGT